MSSIIGNEQTEPVEIKRSVKQGPNLVYPLRTLPANDLLKNQRRNKRIINKKNGHILC
jgi:hypothetical protein